MISVIIPTMGKDPEFPKRLCSLSSNPLVGEIIVIDNTTSGLEFDPSISKLIHIKEGKNTYVNPAWNKGVRLAKSDKLLIMNDDVETDFTIINLIDPHITPEYGMIGSGQSCWYPQHTNEDPALDYIERREMCYGSLYFIHRNSYTPIPETIKIWYGDDWLFNSSGKPNLQIKNWKMYGESSVTAGLPEFNSMLEQDTLNWRLICQGQ